MKITKNIFLILSMFLISIFIHAEDKITVEWAPFNKIKGVSDERLIAIANIVNSRFLIKQQGFISRELVKKNNEEYADIIRWKTKANAISAGNKVNNCTPCGEYFSLMDMVKSPKSGAGFSHYTILKKWQ